MVAFSLGQNPGTDPWNQGHASTRYSTRTRNFLSYSNSTRTKHYSDHVASSINSRNFNNYSEAAGQKIFQDNYSKSWYSNAAVHGKDEQVIWMLKRWRRFPSSTSCILKITWHTSLSPHAHALQQPQVCLDDDQILHMCRFSIVKDCQKIRFEWASTMRRTLSLSFKSWEESLHALNPLLSFINTFPFYQI